jgi:hypothetical protein
MTFDAHSMVKRIWNYRVSWVWVPIAGIVFILLGRHLSASAHNTGMAIIDIGWAVHRHR